MRIGIQAWGTEGDVRPLIALAGGLQSAGHEVTLAVTEISNKNFTPYSERLHFSIRHIGKIEYTEAQLLKIGDVLRKSQNPMQQVHKIVTYFFEPVAEDILQAAKLLCQENDVVIKHLMVYPLALAAEKTNIPCITVFTTPAFPSKYISPPGIPELGRTANYLWWKVGESFGNRLLMPSINKIRVQEGLAPQKNFLREVWASKTLNLIAASPALVPCPPDWENHFKVCGFFNIPGKAETWKMPEELKQFLDAGPPPLYMTFSTIMENDPNPYEITQILVEAALMSGCRAIIQSGWKKINDNHHHIPEHPDIYRITRTPFQYIFPRCAMVVHHGGAGTTQIATQAGCPSVIVAHGTDQTLWGKILFQAGIAPKILHRRSLTAKKLAKAIKTVLATPEMATIAQSIGKNMRKENGVGRAVELISALK